MKTKMTYWPSWIMWAGIIGAFLVNGPFWLTVCGALFTLGLVTGIDDLLRKKLRDHEEAIEKLHQRIQALEDAKSPPDYGLDDEMPMDMSHR